ncbi:MAG: hypothetical protein AABW80_04695 [Nanoarchaeota archaeon]
MTKIKMKDVLMWIAIAIVVVVGILIALNVEKADTPNSVGTETEQVFCTQDIRECSDGSFVSRDSNNNCEFKSCPVG